MDKLKAYFLKYFEQAFVLFLLASVAFINYFIPYKLAFLNFYFIPVLLTAYYLDVRRALMGAVLCLIMVGFFFYLDPQSFYPGTTHLDIALNILTWACFMILGGATVGNLSHKLQQEVRQTVALHEELSTSQAQAIETNKMLGLSFQGQGMLDLAFEKFRRCPTDDSLKDLLYNLAVEFERKRHYPKAVAVYEHIEKADPKYRDIQEKMKSLKDASDGAGGPGGLARLSGAIKPTLGRYEIDRELGRGGMGVIYLGSDPKIHRKVAIKTLTLDNTALGGDANVKELKERFFREAESAGTLNHPNIVRIFDVGEDYDLCYIAMEYLEGHDLIPHTAKGSLLPVRQVLEYVAQVADALDSAHAQGVVHRDIKPANIMLLKDGTIRVVDFGIARIVASSNTASGAVMGTVSYMSPEQVAGRKVDGRSDLFSLGVLLFQLLTGVKPFDGGEGIGTILFRIAGAPEPEPRDLNAEITPAMSEVIHKALKKDPEARYSRGSLMAADLRAAASAPAAPASA